jgi:hypothetical protein
MTCKYCYESGNNLISPCKCDGHLKYVHKDCLTSWLKVNNSDRCELCHEYYSYTKRFEYIMSNECNKYITSLILIGLVFSCINYIYIFLISTIKILIGTTELNMYNLFVIHILESAIFTLNTKYYNLFYIYVVYLLYYNRNITFLVYIVLLLSRIVNNWCRLNLI